MEEVTGRYQNMQQGECLCFLTETDALSKKQVWEAYLVTGTGG